MSDQSDTIPVYIDGEEVQVAPGTNMIEAARLVGKEVPHYCYHPHISVVGNCRMCLVEMGMPGRDRATGNPILNEDGSPKIMWSPKPAIACATRAASGMHIKTQSDMVKECREGIMEFLLINHPLDCPICDQAGECTLQEFATDYGKGYSRFIERKNVKPKRTRLGSRVMLDDERCILCSRCIRFCQEIVDDDVLGFIDRGSYSTLTCYPGKKLENNYSLNTVDICPVGALTSTDFRFKMRVWFLKETPSICTESSVGVNTTIGSREGKIYRITPRRNDSVNDSWMSDSGRTLYKQVDADNRLSHYTLNGKPVSSKEALNESVNLIQQGKFAIVASGRQSVEEQWLLKLLAEARPGTRIHLVSRTGEGDDLLISSDRTPNVRGALITGLTKELPEQDLVSLGKHIDNGEIDTLLVYNECLLPDGLTREQLRKTRIIFLGTHHCETSQQAAVEVPTLTVFEKSGTFINQQFRLQKFLQAIPGPQGVISDLDFLRRVIAQLIEQDYIKPEINEIWRLMSRNVPQFEGLIFTQIPSVGLELDARQFLHHNFIEGKSLHYDPNADRAKESA